jgi:hypothetical protein
MDKPRVDAWMGSPSLSVLLTYMEDMWLGSDDFSPQPLGGLSPASW